MNLEEKIGLALALGWLAIMLLSTAGCFLVMAVVGPFGPPPFLIGWLGVGFLVVPVGVFMLLHGQARRFKL